MDIHDLLQHWVDTDLGPHFSYGETGRFHYIRCKCYDFDCAILRVEDNQLCIIDPVKSIEYFEQDKAFGYTRKDDIASIPVADPNAFDDAKNLVHKVHDIGKEAWEKFRIRNPNMMRK